MRCMCPNCGLQMESNDMVFNLIKVANSELQKRFRDKFHVNIEDQDYLQHIDDSELEKAKRAKQNWEAISKDHYLWISSEDILKSKISNDNSQGKFFQINIDLNKIQKKIEIKPSGNQTGNDQRSYSYEEATVVDDFLKDVEEENNEGRKDFTANLILMKEGDGDIDFNIIRYGNSLIATDRFCPNCHSKMSYYSGRYPEITLTVFGGKRISKTSNMIACASTFMKEGSPIVWEMNPRDDNYSAIKEMIESYRRGKRVDPTDPKSIPRITFKVKYDEGKYLNLTFIDVPGEYNDKMKPQDNSKHEESFGTVLDRADQIFEKNYDKIFQGIDFIWYCTDPVEIEQRLDINAQKRCGDDRGDPLSGEELKMNMDSWKPLCQNGKIPMAYIVGKSDEIKDEDKKDLLLYENTCRHQDEMIRKRQYDLKKVFDKAVDTRTYIKKYIDIIPKFEEDFYYRCYFSVSAYGRKPISPNADNNITMEQKPYQCAMPFLWMLAVKGYIPIKYSFVEEAPLFKKIFNGHNDKSSRKVFRIKKLDQMDDKTKGKVLMNLFMRNGERYASL